MKAALACLLIVCSIACAEPDERQGRIFWAAVTDIAAGRSDQAIASLRQLQREAPGTSVATRAQALIGCALERQGRAAEAVEAYRATRRMDGCGYGDRAQFRARQLKDQASPLPPESGPPIAAWLAATEPRPGLSRAEDVERQNRRARALLAGPHDRGLADRLRAECADVEILPGMLLMLATPDDDWAGPRPVDQPAPPRDGALLRQVAEAYPRSLIGQTAAVNLFNGGSMPEGLLADATDPSLPGYHGPWAWLQRFPTYDPEHEPLPAAVAWYRAQGSQRTVGTVAEEAERRRPELAQKLLCLGNTDAYLRLVEQFPGLRSEPETRLARTQPDAARLYMRAMCGDPEACRELAKSGAGPELAQAALRRLADLAHPREPVWRELATTYPASGPGLWAASCLAAKAGDLAKARTLAERASGKPLPWDEPDWWRRVAMGALDEANTRAPTVSACLPLLPGLTRAQATAAIERALSSREPADWAPLVEAAGPRLAAVMSRLRPLTGRFNDLIVAPRPGQPPLILDPLGAGECACCTPTSATLEQVVVAYNAGIAESVWPLSKVLGGLDSGANEWELAECRLLAKRYAGTPAADLLRVRYGRTLYNDGWYGESEALVQPVAAGQGPRRSVARAILTAARERLVALRQPAWPQVWRAKLAMPGTPVPAQFERAVMDTSRVFALASAKGDEWLVVALDRADGREIWRVGLPMATTYRLPYPRGNMESLVIDGDAVLVSWSDQHLALARDDGRTLRRGSLAKPKPRGQPESYAEPLPDGRSLEPVRSSEGQSLWYTDQRFLLRYNSDAGRPLPVCALPAPPLAADHAGVLCADWDLGLTYLAAPLAAARR